MKYQQSSTIKNLVFYISLLGFICYLLLIVVSAFKILPAFVMQFILAFDALKNFRLSSLITTNQFLFNFVSGLIFLYLLSIFLKGTKQNIIKIIATRRYIREINAQKNRHNFYLFKSAAPQVFTAGFLNPKIYLSSSFLKLFSAAELKSVLLHEFKHQADYDPLKTFIIDLFTSVTPFFPLKTWFVNQYHTLVEVGCDQYSEEVVKTKNPLIIALFKYQSFLESNHQFIVSSFISQSSRIKILTGRQQFRLKPLVAFSSFLFVVFALSSLYLSGSNVFYKCQHLIDCFRVYVFNSPSSNPHFNVVSTPVSKPIDAHCNQL